MVERSLSMREAPGSIPGLSSCCIKYGLSFRFYRATQHFPILAPYSHNSSHYHITLHRMQIGRVKPHTLRGPHGSGSPNAPPP